MNEFLTWNAVSKASEFSELIKSFTVVLLGIFIACVTIIMVAIVVDYLERKYFTVTEKDLIDPDEAEDLRIKKQWHEQELKLSSMKGD